MHRKLAADLQVIFPFVPMTTGRQVADLFFARFVILSLAAKPNNKNNNSSRARQVPAKLTPHWEP